MRPGQGPSGVARELHSASHIDSRPRQLAILGFHKVGEQSPGGWETWYYVPEATFAGYMSYLCVHGWQVIDHAAFLRGLASPDNLPQRAALLTFDDGYRSIRDSALRCLLQFDYPAVLFVPTNYIGGRNTFDQDVEPDEAICGWADLKELERRGVSIQSHAVTHRAFSDLDLADQAEELLRSKAVLEAGLDKPVETFAYPYGDAGLNPGALRSVLEDAGYRAACLYGGGPISWPITDPFQLTRLAMGPDTDLAEELEQS